VRNSGGGNGQLTVGHSLKGQGLFSRLILTKEMRLLLNTLRAISGERRPLLSSRLKQRRITAAFAPFPLLPFEQRAAGAVAGACR